jgi:protein TonB
MDAKAPRTLSWALLASVSLHAVAASWIAPIGTPAVRTMAPLQAVLAVPKRQIVEPPVSPAAAPVPQPHVGDKSALADKRRSAARPVLSAPPLPLPSAESEPMVVPPTVGAIPLPAAGDGVPAVVAGVVAAAVPAAAAAPILPPSFHAAYLDNPKPSYPPAARRRGLQGETRLEVLVAANGLPQEVKIARSSGNDELDDAAQAAVKRWRFVPARRGEEKVDGWVEVPIAFRLER